MKLTVKTLLVLTVICLAQETVNADVIEEGKVFLLSTQQLDGSWGDDPNSFEQFVDTAYGLCALNEEHAVVQPALEWIRSRDRQTITGMAWSIELLSPEGDDMTNTIQTLLSTRASDWGWGAEQGFTGDILHTTLALRALKSADSCPEDVETQAVSFILHNQNDDGAWGYARGKDWGPDPVYADESLSASNVYVTSLVIQTFKEVDLGWNGNISLAVAWLKSIQHPAGGWPGDADAANSDTISTGHALRALILAGEAGPHIDRAVNYLIEHQLSDGSWNSEVFDTAVAILALELYEPPPECTYTLRPGQSITNTWCEELDQAVFDQLAMYWIDTSGVVSPLLFADQGVQLLWPPPQICVDFELSVAQGAEPGIYPFEVLLYLYDSSQQELASFTLSECVIVPLPGDLDGDWNVNLRDFADFARLWRRDDCAVYNNWCEGADLAPDTPDGTVNIEDLAVVAENWLSTI